MTFTADPPSTILPHTSWPLMLTLMLGLCSSITVGPFIGFVKLTATSSVLFLAII